MKRFFSTTIIISLLFIALCSAPVSAGLFTKIPPTNIFITDSDFNASDYYNKTIVDDKINSINASANWNQTGNDIYNKNSGWVNTTGNTSLSAGTLKIFADNKVGVNVDQHVSTSPMFSVGAGGHEYSVFSVNGNSIYQSIANYRDEDGENIFKASGSLAGNDLQIAFGDMDDAYGGSYLVVDQSSRVDVGNSDLYVGSSYDVCIAGGNCLSTVGSGTGNSTAWNRSGTNVYLANITDNVGIGTDNPSYKLTIDAGATYAVGIRSTGYGSMIKYWRNGGSYSFAAGVDTAAYSRWVIQNHAGTNLMTVTNDGKIGIGWGATNPIYNLDILGSVQIKGAASPGRLILWDGRQGIGGEIAQRSDGRITITTNKGSYAGHSHGVIDILRNGLINIPNGDFSVDTNTLFIDASNSRTGIGTSSPDYKLDVYDPTTSIISLGKSGVPNFKFLINYSGETAYLGTTSNDGIGFKTNGANRMSIASEGNITIADANDLKIDGDYQKIYFGADQDSSIYYDGTDMNINPKNTGSGKLSILGDLNVTGKIHNSLSHMIGAVTQIHTVDVIDTWYNLTFNNT